MVFVFWSVCAPFSLLLGLCLSFGEQGKMLKFLQAGSLGFVVDMLYGRYGKVGCAVQIDDEGKVYELFVGG